MVVGRVGARAVAVAARAAEGRGDVRGDGEDGIETGDRAAIDLVIDDSAEECPADTGCRRAY